MTTHAPVSVEHGAGLDTSWRGQPVSQAYRALAQDSRVRYAVGVVSLIGLYYASAKLGYALQFSGPVAAIVWLPVGVGIAFLYYAGLKFWPGVVIGDLLVNNYSALPFGAAVGQTFGNLLEVVTATVLLHRFIQRGSPLGTVGGVARTFIALAVGTAISATIGSLSSLLGHAIAARSFGSVWRTWWLGDLSGALLVVPLAIAWYRPLSPGLLRRRSFEAAAALASVAGLTALAATSPKELAYLVFPGLIWSAVRLRLRGATLAVAVAAGMSIWATTHYVGPFSSHSMTRSVLETQLFIIVASLTTLCLAAAVTAIGLLALENVELDSAWKESLGELADSRARLVRASERERRKLERDLHDGAQQRLVAASIDLSLAGELVDSNPDLHERVGAASVEVEEALAELREVAHGIYPPALGRWGAAQAFELLANRYRGRVAVIEADPRRFAPELEAAIYYCCLEAVQNASKHAGRDARISIRLYTTTDRLHLEVRDDGRGFDAAGAHDGVGLQNMRDRLGAVGGCVEISSHPGHGTLITATAPRDRRLHRSTSGIEPGAVAGSTSPAPAIATPER
jgi:signal transduction histidine kinase